MYFPGINVFVKIMHTVLTFEVRCFEARYTTYDVSVEDYEHVTCCRDDSRGEGGRCRYNCPSGVPWHSVHRKSVQDINNLFRATYLIELLTSAKV